MYTTWVPSGLYKLPKKGEEEEEEMEKKEEEEIVTQLVEVCQYIWVTRVTEPIVVMRDSDDGGCEAIKCMLNTIEWLESSRLNRTNSGGNAQQRRNG